MTTAAQLRRSAGGKITGTDPIILATIASEGKAMITKRASAIPLLCSAIAPILCHTPSADAGLNIDFRATGIEGQGVRVNQKTVQALTAGSVVRFDIFAVVTGTNGTNADDKFISVSGSLRSTNIGTPGNILGDLVRSVIDPNTGQILSAGFDGVGFSVGTQQDLDGDGDLDVGSNNDSEDNHFWAAHHALGTGAPAGSASPTTGGRRIGFGTFTVTSQSFIVSLINFDGRNAMTAASYIQDGQIIHEPSFKGFIPISALSWPEPTMLGVAGLTGLAICRPRR
jgi:hypothetical protein